MWGSFHTALSTTLPRFFISHVPTCEVLQNTVQMSLWIYLNVHFVHMEQKRKTEVGLEDKARGKLPMFLSLDGEFEGLVPFSEIPRATCAFPSALPAHPA